MRLSCSASMSVYSAIKRLHYTGMIAVDLESLAVVVLAQLYAGCTLITPF